ncbi:nitrogenase molybdenum-iron protein beta chain [Citreicella sp. SE45]|nr:nitrogenase molybdenum-iron protein beta chain [Citreicella sp. SE45]
MAAEMGSVEDLELEDVLKVGYRPRLEGKSVMFYVGGLRPRHVVTAYDDLGMVIAGTGNEFGHNDDCKRTGHYVKDGTLIYDDVTGYELEKFIEKIRPDLVVSGIKEKSPVQKMGIPFRQMHSWDYSGPYYGYDGFAIFARDMDLAINNPVWGMYAAPWDKPETGPAIAAECPLPPGGACSRALRAGQCLPHITGASRNADGQQKDYSHASVGRQGARSRTALPATRIQGHAGQQESEVRIRPSRRDVQEIGDWTKSWEYREKNLAREALTVNPAKACQPLGAVFASQGYEATMPFVHGSQGCVAYYRSHLSRHFKEPSSCVSSSMTEDAAVVGGLNNMVDGLANTKALYNPKMIAVSTTCMRSLLNTEPCDMLIGNSYGKHLERDTGSLLIRLMFPIFDRHHHHRFPTMGYQGVLNVLVKLLDTVFDKLDDDTIIPGETDYSYDLTR